MASKKVFISMPMAGKSREEIESLQNETFRAVEEALDEDVELIKSCIEGKGSPFEILTESLKLMTSADYAVFADGWENARGCKVERLCAEEYGIKIIDVKSIDLKGDNI